MRSRIPVGIHDDVPGAVDDDHPSGIPVGASRSELLGGLLGLAALVLIGLAFWFGARP